MKSRTLLVIVLVAFILWAIYRATNKPKVIAIRVVAPETPKPIVINRYVVSQTGTVTTGDDFYQEINFTNLTDQTFTHTAGRYVDADIIVNGESIDALVTYPATNQIRVQSNTPITGILILT
ncbi:MAG: hypothetical protein U0X91_30785 [Spirosomataceae bacterium]